MNKPPAGGFIFFTHQNLGSTTSTLYPLAPENLMSVLNRKTPAQELSEWTQRLHDDIKSQRMSLPVLPEVTRKLRDVVNDNNVQLRALAQVLAAEPALVAKILKSASSSLMGLEPTQSVETAIARLGVNSVRGMVFNYCLSKLFKERQTGPLKEELRRVWQRSTLTGLYGQMLAQRLKLENSYALLAGLIHNVGALPIIALFTQRKELAGKLELMRAMISAQQAELSEMIARNWGLSAELIAIPRQLKQENEQSTLLDITRCAIKLAEWYESPGYTVDGIARLPAAQRLKIDGAQLASWVADSRAEVSDLCHVLSD
jgi:HD-like signal output (HDOD) protein